MKLVPDLSVSPGLVASAAEVGVAGKQFISLMRSCEIVEVRNVEDALGDPCSKEALADMHRLRLWPVYYSRYTM